MTHSIRCCIVATSLVALASTLLAQIPFAAIAPGAIKSDAADAFQQLYRTSDAGGAFRLRAVFPLTGDASQVAAFEAAINNSEGATTAARTKF